jgi:hypothetical protein
MRVIMASLTLLTVLRLDPCSGGGGETDTPPAQTRTPPNGGGEGGQNGAGGNGADTTAGVTVPELFYETWTYTTVSSYPEGGGEPKVTGLRGTETFTPEGTYEQTYVVGSLSFTNHYSGTYRVVGSDPRVDGAFLIETTDQDAQKQTWSVALDVGLKRKALTLYNADGSPSMILGSKISE